MTLPDEQLEELVCYTPEALSELAGSSVHTIYRHLSNNKIPGAFRIGGQWRIPEQSAITYLGYDPTKVKVRLVK